MGTYHVIENGVITNVIVCDDAETAAAFNAVYVHPEANIGDQVDADNNLVKSVRSIAEIETAEKEIEMREKRNALLAQTDFYCLSDMNPSQEMLDYRQALRDLPSQDGFPDVDFPAAP